MAEQEGVEPIEEDFIDIQSIKPNRKKRPRKKSSRTTEAIPTETVAAIIAAYMTCQFDTDRQIAEHFGVSSGSMTRIKRKIPPEILERFAKIKAFNFDSLILEAIQEGLKANIRISKQTSNEVWMDKQSAAELATLTGVTADKTLRLIEIINSSQPEEVEVL